MSTANIVLRATKMNVSAIFVFCCAIILQSTDAAPAEIAIENPLIQNAAAGDLLLQTPEPLKAGASVSIGPDTFSTTLNDSLDQAQVGDHLLPSSTPTVKLPNGNTSASPSTLPGASATGTGSPGAYAIATGSPGAYATSTGSPGAYATAAGSPGGYAYATGLPGSSTLETTTSPFDNELEMPSGPATTTGLAVADPMIFYRIFTNLLRQPEQFMQSLMNPTFSGMASGFPSMRMPSLRSPLSSVGMGFNDPSLKLVDQKVIDDGTVKGQFNMYEGQPDPNTQTKMQTGQFSVNKDGLQGGGVSHYYSSSSSSSSPGGGPAASVSSFFGGLPRLNMGFPLRLI